LISGKSWHDFLFKELISPRGLCFDAVVNIPVINYMYYINTFAFRQNILPNDDAISLYVRLHIIAGGCNICITVIPSNNMQSTLSTNAVASVLPFLQAFA